MKVLLLLLLPNVDAYSTATSRHFAYLSRHAPLQLAVVESDVIAATQVASAISETLPAAGRVVPTMRKRDRLRQVLQFPRNAVSVGKAINEAAEELVGDSCDVDAPEVCEDESKFKAAKRELGALIRKSLFFWQGSATNKDLAETEADSMESGWVQRGQGSAFKRTTEVWGFLARSGLRVVKAGKTKGTPEEVSATKTAAAEFIRDGLFTLGPTFVKLGQVVSTRSDVLEKEYIEVLKDLQDNVPGFGGDRAVQIIEKELGKPIGQIFDSFEREPIAAASLGQVHKAVYKGTAVAVKVQRAGLKELFDTDLKNLKVLVKLLDKFDPKSDGADRSYADIYDESAKLLYEEIDYMREGRNGARFAQTLAKVGLDYIKVPTVFWEVTNERVLTMEFVESFKLTDVARVEAEGLDRKLLADRVADSFLAQILKTGYFHCDPHPGNLCVNKEGKLVFYDCGMMNELQPNVAKGFKEACFAIFGGGPFISEIQLDAAGKRLVDALELMGVLAKSADRLSVEKLARYFIRTFKDVQLGKSASNIKTTLGADLQALTDQQVFRFPSTFTFIFRAFASVDGIGKGLTEDFDIPKLAQPFINELTVGDVPKSVLEVFLERTGKATGLNTDDVNTALNQPRKVAYLEQTLRAMEQGNLKIRVRSLENERALARVALTQEVTNNLLVTSLLLHMGLARLTPLPALWLLGAGAFFAKAGGAALSIKIFDKKAARYEAKDFGDVDATK
jgi:predicted unusual protein kinase regulating ubiquinone biosynthesis (AarF/ABC1/UbiB family)